MALACQSLDLPEDSQPHGDEEPQGMLSQLREALRDFADSDNKVSETSLRDVSGFTDEVAETLAAQLGPGPWHVEKLEQLFFGAAGEELDEEPTSCGSSPVKGLRAHSPRPQWSSTVSPIRRRHTVGFASEVPSYTDADDMEDDGLGQLSAQVEAALRGEEEVTNLLPLLRRTWRIAQGLEQQRHRLQCEAKLQSERVASAENARASAEAAEAVAQGALQTAGQRQAASRESLKRREEELEEARLRAEGLEAEVARQAARLRSLEERLRRAEEDRDRKVTPRASDDPVQSELRRQVATANAAAEALRDEVLACEEAVAMERQRSLRLEAELREGRDELADQKARVQALETVASRGSSGNPRSRQRRSQASIRTDLATPALSEELHDAPDAAAGPKVVPAAACDRKARLQAQLAQRGVQKIQLMESPNRQGEGKVPKSSEGPTRASGAGRHQSSARQTGMPADMRSLSRLLSGSGWLGSPPASG